MSFGPRGFGAGFSFTWNNDEDNAFGRHKSASWGLAGRKGPIALSCFQRYDHDEDESYTQADAAVRLFGSRLTLFADGISRNDQNFFDGTFGGGLAVMPVPGLEIAGRYSDTDDGHTVGLRLSVGLGQNVRMDVASISDDDDKRMTTGGALEFGPFERQLGRDWFGKASRYPRIKLKGRIRNRRPSLPFFLFSEDKGRTLVGTLAQIDRHADDPMVGGVVVNLSGVRASGEMLWEIREQLAGLRARGKKVIVYFDHVGLGPYALATVADQIWIDPEGYVAVPGLAFGRTYYAGALEKIGIGVEEFRLYEYKSLMDTYTRSSMSEADREQLSAMLDDFYAEFAAQATAGRGLTPAEWDRVIDDEWLVVPDRALELGLVDSIGTWDDAKKAAKTVGRRAGADRTSAELGTVFGDRDWAGYRWGQFPKIAVLYAIGPCAMEEGIRARSLAKAVKRAGEDGNVAAIVLRVDSPGGDGLASDLVARELQKAAGAKPVIVSQGSVAASGGYWISAPADTILASPLTVTASIGVIGGHFWDAGIGDSLGITYDYVKRGAHADLNRGMRLPLLGVIPERPFSEEERAHIEGVIDYWYDGFVRDVAEERGMTEEAVREVGEGRVWSGADGVELGLVDELGGLWRSIQLAKEAAGLGRDDAVRLVTGPAVPFDFADLFNLSLPGLSLGRDGLLVEHPAGDHAAESPWELGTDDPVLLSLVGPRVFGALTQPERVYLEYLLRADGRPLHMMPPVEMTEQ